MKHIETRGVWSMPEIAHFLQQTTIPMRLAAHLADGFPVVLSLWFVWESDALWAAVRPDSRIARHIANNPRCAFEVAGDLPPYRGVRGQATGVIIPEKGGEILSRLITRYLGDASPSLAKWLLSRSDSEVAIRLDPIRFSAWDYASRMDNAAPTSQETSTITKLD